MREAFKARGRNCLLYLGTPTHQQSSLSCHTSLSFSSASTLQYSLSLPSTLSLSLSLSHSFSIEYSLCIEYFLYIDVESLSNSHARHMFGNVLHARHMFGNVQGTCSETCFLSMLSLYAFSLYRVLFLSRYRVLQETYSEKSSLSIQCPCSSLQTHYLYSVFAQGSYWDNVIL